MDISFDPEKRARTLAERGLDFLDAPRVFERRSVTLMDDRRDYGEVRYLTYGWMDEVPVAMVWTWRGGSRRIISMRRMHAEEVEYVGLD